MDELIAGAEEIGFPVFVKAVAGGGGRGMRRVEDPKMLRESVTAAMREAEGAFGDPTAYIEQAVGRPRHIEVQILADAGQHTSICSSATARSSGGTRSSSRSARPEHFE